MSFIVKVQASLAASCGHRTILIYSQDRSIWLEAEAHGQLLELLKGRQKVYCLARMGTRGTLDIDYVVEDQAW